MKNIFEHIPQNLPTEVFDALYQDKRIKIERILSKGHRSPPDNWYDQDHDEWVLIIEGEAAIQIFGNPIPIKLIKGDHLFIPAHQKHVVLSTARDEVTIWLTIHIFR